MGCTSSSPQAVRKGSKTAVVSLNHQVYASVKKRMGSPSSYKEDGYEIGLRIKDAVAGMYSLYIGTSRKTGEKVSLKEIFLANKADTELEARIVQEVAILSRLSTHSGCPLLKELFIIEGQSLYIVMDYMDTFRLKNFVDVRTRKSSFLLPEVRKVFKSLLSIIVHTQEQSVILRSLSLDNVMAVKKGRRPSKETAGAQSAADFDVRITDLSQAVDFGDITHVTDHPLFDWNNQLPFIAPECALKQPYHSACDIWSLGVILFALIAGELPFSVDDFMDRAKLIDKIKNGEFSFANEPWPSMRKEVKTLIQSMLVVDPVNRATAAEIRRNEWVLNG